MAKATKKSENLKKNGNAREVGSKSGASLATTWGQYLKVNNKTRLTDDQLRAAMGDEFPSKKDKTTIMRVSMIRGVYNKGTNMFKAVGPAAVASVAYDEDGQAIAPRSNATAAGGNSGKKKASKKVSKKVSKKASKKVSKKASKKSKAAA